ncbi:MAG: hypothetical protein CMG04_02080 [Candidatus Marinimicrobia bacterium]|nr:hypothetical protein [Candidatus Neomarinimicrobiota bacterium]|tara:strand:- start:2114 stop:3325 length:1212 start_codon:yes stop_codon:yes gene_type:complete
MISIFFENFSMAFSSVLSNKTRSLLTALGIIIGVFSVTLMGTLISGLDRSFEGSMSMLGRDILYISRYEWFGDQEWWEVRNRPRMKIEYVNKIKNKSRYALAVAPVMQRGAELSSKEDNIRTEIFGTNIDYIKTISADIKEGRFFSNSDDRKGRRVTVVGHGIKDVFFKGKNPIGENIKIDGEKFRIIGVLEKQGKFLGLFSVDNQAIIPQGAYMRLFSRRGWTRLSVKVPEQKIEEAKDEIYSIMRQIRGLKPNQKDDFAINQTKAFEKQYNSIKIAIAGTGFFITMLSLVVGGIGIMNIMFVSVTERTREIGVRKAIGATKNMILSQFLMEAITICLAAGIIGLIFAYIISLIINNFFPSTMPLGLSILAVLMSIIVGVVSGIIPSYKAANLDPIDSLRYE